MSTAVDQVKITSQPTPSVQGTMDRPPHGVILHGTRSGIPRTIWAEYRATAAYAASGGGPDGLAWHATGGEGELSTHMTARQWGYHAREASTRWLGYEFAQALPDDAITDAQIVACVAWLVRVVLPDWPALDLRTLPIVGHSETVPGMRDGKTDVFPRGDARMQDVRLRLRRRILEEIAAPPPAPTWTVGPGLTAAITAAGERIMSNEIYHTTDQGQYSTVHTDRAIWTYQADADGRNERIYRAGTRNSP